MGFEKVTAFHNEMADARPLKKTVSVCGAAVQRIVYASERGTASLRALPDRRAPARRPDRCRGLLKGGDWPASIDDV